MSIFTSIHSSIDRQCETMVLLSKLSSISAVFILVASLLLSCHAFHMTPDVRFRGPTTLQSQKVSLTEDRIVEATQILADWDRTFNPESPIKSGIEAETLLPKLADAVRTLNQKATEERTSDAAKGRCMLGICASSTQEGIATLKSWVTNLELPRGLLHGMDKDGVPLELNGGVYIKYNSGGVYTFADIRKSQMGFNALWKPGDAMLEEYDGTYRGVYFQVELTDGEFRQYLVPLDIFGL